MGILAMTVINLQGRFAERTLIYFEHLLLKTEFVTFREQVFMIVVGFHIC